MNDNNDFWKRKLLAFLHDPPSKPLDIPGHPEVAESIRRRAGLDETEVAEFARICDWTAAAADRFPFPIPGKLKSSFTGSRKDSTPFRHPLGGSDLFLDPPFPSDDFAESVFQTAQPASDFELAQLPQEERDWANFFLHWRRWPEEAARSDSRCPFLPADTRIPDHNVWTHNSVVSALEGCMERGVLRPAFLLFHFGPVQDFIEQARSTRDLWSGSYLISWLMAHAVKAVTDEVGPDCILFPALRGQPLFDYLHRSRLYDRINYGSGSDQLETLWQRMGATPESVLTPNLPNRFLAVVPQSQGQRIAELAKEAVCSELTQISHTVWNWFAKIGAELDPDWKSRFESQIQAFPKIWWAVYPWSKAPIRETLEAYRSLVPDKTGSAANLQSVHWIAVEAVPKEDRDARYFTDPDVKTDLNNAGFCWSYHYALADWLLAGRRRLRDFVPWSDPSQAAGAVKDSFSGVEEVVGTEDWWRKVRENPSLCHLFRSADRLGAVNLIKKVWHLAYLKEARGLQVGRQLRFESVPGVAAGKWRQDLLVRLRDDQAAWVRIQHLRQCLIENREETLRRDLQVSIETNEEIWLSNTDPSCFSPEEWDEETGDAVRRALTEFYFEAGVRKPPVYYAVLAFDGDDIGKWVSGQKTPPLLSQMSRGAQAYFEKLDLGERKSTRRPLSPSYHLQFSEALTNFGLYVVRPIVNHFGGQLIYSGGDDALAMLPAETALDCAEALVAAFRGQRRLEELVPNRFQVHGENGGFVSLKPEYEGDRRPGWPLIVPGPGTFASVGIAVGHIRSPLQGLIRAARTAEKRAKQKPGKAACAVSLYKRSGEIVHWEFKWEGNALPLYRCFVGLSRNKESGLSSRFAYALRGFLRPYAPAAELGRENGAVAQPLQNLEGFPVRRVVDRELRHVLRRQGSNLNESSREEFLRLCGKYLDGLVSDGDPEVGPPWRLLEEFPLLFETANFIRRGE